MNKEQKKKKISKRIVKFITRNIMGFIIGIIVASTLTVLAATVLNSSEVSYNNTTSGLSSTTVQGALDELYIKAANSGVPIDPDTFQINTAKTVYASSKGICIFRNNKLNCFKNNNWAEEQNHIQEVFRDVNCEVYSSYVDSNASDFRCNVRSGGGVFCFDYSDNSSCNVASGGSVYCC